MRNLNEEFTDNEHRQYAYDFDYKMHAYLLRTFQPFLPEGRAVELGCYHGMFTERLLGVYDDVSVVEGASDLIEVAKTRVGDRVNFHHSMFEDFTPAQPYDAAFLMHTLEHLDGPVEVLRKIGTWLSPQGKLFVAVPNAHAASRQIAVGMGLIDHASAVTEGEKLHGHRCTYSIDTLMADIKAAGLHVETFGGVMFKPLANYQLDASLQNGTIDDAFLEGCYVLGKRYPDLCASIYAVCTPAPQ